MDNRIPEDFIEEVRRQADIVSIISEHVILRRAGKNYQGLCPFHSEKTPSFNVNPDRQMFYCFGCHSGGNVFSFLMKKLNLTFIEALKIVAQRVGIELPEKELSPLEKKTEQRRNRWREIHEWTAAFFHDVLVNRPEGKPGLEYLNRRGISLDVIKSFKLGYAPDRWDALLKEMDAKGVTPEELSDFGLVVQKGDSDNSRGFYDRFRNRVIFAILDIRNAPIAFGGRVLDDTLPKYINSPETEFFHKGRNLYGMHTAYRGIRDAGYALLVEGYMDTIAVQKAGFAQAVASLGTALTKDQAKYLKRYTNKVIIGYDADEAGIQAALRAGEILLAEGLKVEVLHLDGAKDPDEYLNKHSREEFKSLLERTLTFIEFKYQKLVKAKPPRTIPDKAELIRELAVDIVKNTSAVEREGYERFLSLELGLTLEAVQHEITSISPKTSKYKDNQEIFSQKQDISVKKRNTIEGTKFDYPLDSFVSLGVFKAEQMILRLILENPLFKTKLLENLHEHEMNFWRLPEHKYIFEHCSESLHSVQNDVIYEQIQKRLAEIYQIDIDLTHGETLLNDCLASIRLSRNKETIEDLQARMIELEKTGDMAGALSVLQQIGERLKRG